MFKWLVTRTPVSRAERLLVAVAAVVLLTAAPGCGPALAGLLGLPIAALEKPVS